MKPDLWKKLAVEIKRLIRGDITGIKIARSRSGSLYVITETRTEYPEPED